MTHMDKELLMERLPTAFCHASTLVRTRDGGLLCCWFGGSHEGEPDTAIYVARREHRSFAVEGSAKPAQGAWSRPVKLVDGGSANWNPVLFYRADGVLQLFCKQGQRIASWRTLVLLSEDDGRTWSEPRELVAGDVSGGRGPVRNKPLRLADGRVLAGASTEHGIWRAFADISDDDGRSWRKSESVYIDKLSYREGEKTADSAIAVSEQSFYGRGVIQPSLWQGADGTVHMLLRSSEGFVYRADSEDGGEHWSRAYPLSLPNNNSGLDLTRVAGGSLLLVCNPVAANWGQRSPLSVFLSRDDGDSWERFVDLETEVAEFSYPAIIADGDEVYISYTWKRQNIACVRFNAVDL